jgi:hypothetical protein
MLGENRNATKKTQALLDSSREAGLEGNPWKTKYMVVSHYQNVGLNHNLLVANKYFENLAKFKYLRTTITNQNCIHEEIKSRLNLGNACYHSVQNLLDFHKLED